MKRASSLTMTLGVAAAIMLSSNALAEQKSRDQRKAAGEVYWSAGDEPPSMDPTKQADTISGFWLGHLYEGLMSYDKASNVVPGTAESYKVSDDKKTWTFKIRKTAKWHDGKPVVAGDFVYAWQRLVDPSYASEYSFIASAAGLLNAEDIVAKKKTKDQLGVKALDDATLQVTLSRPIPYFDSMMAFQIFYPVRKDIAEKFGDKFAAVADSVVGNGPFKLAVWNKEQSMRIVKADTYWNAAAIKLNAIESPAMVKDVQANFNNLQTGGIDFAELTSPEVIKQASDNKLKIRSFSTGCIDYIQFNTKAGRPFASKELRLAVQNGISRSEYVNKIIGIPGYKPAFGLVPDYMPGSKAGSTYRKEAPLSWKDGDVAAAKKQIEAYAKASGNKTPPPFTILAGDSTRARKYAEYFQNSLSKLLGTDVKIETVPFKVRLQKTRDYSFDAVLAGWCPDYRDAMTFMDLLTSTNENNNSGWANKEFDDLIQKAGNEPDLVKRVAFFQQAEKVLVGDAPIVSHDQSGGAYVVAPGIQDIVRHVFGANPDFRYASWSDKAAH